VKIIQRILGMIAILSLFLAIGAIFMRYTKPGQLVNNMPFVMPQVDFEIDDNLQANISYEDQVAQTKSTAASAPQKTQATRGEPFYNEKPSPQAWVVQVGTFSQIDNAIKLLQKLQDSGFHASSRQVFISDKIMTQVIVGPEPDYGRAIELQSRLADRIQLKGRVVSFSAERN
jgi:cell division septation protein DedD